MNIYILKKYEKIEVMNMDEKYMISPKINDLTCKAGTSIRQYELLF